LNPGNEQYSNYIYKKYAPLVCSIHQLNRVNILV
jgi:hypothetical protein